MRQGPDWPVVPKMSCDVLLIAMPVSKPAWLVTNGKSRFVRQGLMMKMLPVEGRSMKRGIGPVVAVPTVLIGAKLRVPVAVPRPAELGANATKSGMSIVSTAFGSDDMTSYT